MSLTQIIAGHHGALRSKPNWAQGVSAQRLSPAAFRDSTVFPHITRDAKRLSVSRYHLWAVLTGRRQSRSLLARYNTLKSKEAA